MTNSIDNILAQLVNADNKSKSILENELVEIGNEAVPELVKTLSVAKGTVRGVIAMTLIRIGQASVECLRKAAMVNKDLKWIADYLITEINLAA